MNRFDPALAVVISAFVAAVGVLVSAWLGRRNSHEANEVAEFKETIAGMKVLQERQDKTLQEQDVRITTLETHLAAERKEHSTTRELLVVAMKHIRDMLSWLGGDRKSDPPLVPDELTNRL